jgi:tetratricopeptide (TPR) repeat protein
MSGYREIVRLLLPFTLLSHDGIPSELLNDETKKEELLDFLLEQGKERLKEWEERNNPISSREGEKNSSSSSSSNDEVVPKSLQYFESLPSRDRSNNTSFESQAEEWKEKGNHALKNHSYNDAIVAYSEAIKLNKFNHVYWSNRSAVYLTLQQYDLALRDAEVCRRLAPSWSKGCYRLAAARLALKQYEDAALAAFEGCKLDPKNEELKLFLQKAVKEGQKEHQKQNNKK